MRLKSIVKRAMPYEAKMWAKGVMRTIYKMRSGQKDINTEYELSVLGDNRSHTFFGYYDITPFNINNELIYLEVPDGQPSANIVWNKLDGSDRKIVAKTNAWNTQQGARLRWYPGQQNVICFNDFVNNQYINRRINLETSEEKIISEPVYDISPDGRWGVTLNFERLGVLRPGYGYTNRDYVQETGLSNEGISLVEMSTGTKERLLTYHDIASALGLIIDDYSSFYINHLSFSPDGSKFLFFWLKNIPNWAEAALLTYDIKTGKIVVLEKELRVSHYTWLDNDTILCTAIAGTSIYDMKCRYYIYKEGNNRQVIGGNVLLRDGHPTLYKTGIILTDTYPDKHSFQELFLYDMNNNTKKRLVYSFSVPVKDGVYRTDMHPRFNVNKTIICYDANVCGHRHLYILKNWDK